MLGGNTLTPHVGRVRPLRAAPELISLCSGLTQHTWEFLVGGILKMSAVNIGSNAKPDWFAGFLCSAARLQLNAFLSCKTVGEEGGGASLPFRPEL